MISYVGVSVKRYLLYFSVNHTYIFFQYVWNNSLKKVPMVKQKNMFLRYHINSFFSFIVFSWCLFTIQDLYCLTFPYSKSLITCLGLIPAWRMFYRAVGLKTYSESKRKRGGTWILKSRSYLVARLCCFSPSSLGLYILPVFKGPIL